MKVRVSELLDMLNRKLPEPKGIGDRLKIAKRPPMPTYYESEGAAPCNAVFEEAELIAERFQDGDGGIFLDWTLNI